MAVLCGCVVGWQTFAGQALAAPVPGDGCPNGHIRKAQGTSHLPDCMALEMVSPPQKDGQAARIATPTLEAGTRSPEFGGISPDGNRVFFISLGALGGTPALLRVSGDPYVASRDAAGQQWITSPTSPANGMAFGARSAHPLAFSADFASWFQMAASESEFFSGLGRVFRGSVDSTQFTDFSPLLTPFDPIPVGETPFDTIGNSLPRGASADFSTFVFQPGPEKRPTRYFSGDPIPAGAGSERNRYVARRASGLEPTLSLLARDGAGKVWGGNCGANIAGGDGAIGTSSRGAISADGSRIYFTTRPGQPFDSAAGEGPVCSTASKLRIMLREETSSGLQTEELFASECDRVANLPSVPACGTAGPTGKPLPDADDSYQGASVDGSKVYFISSRQLTDSDTNGLEGFGLPGTCSGFFIGGCDLYLYDADEEEGERLTQITASGTGTVVPKVVTFSGDGSRLYFISTQVLTTEPGPGGKTPVAGQGNLYLWDAEAEGLSFVATIGSGAVPNSQLNAWAVPVLGEDHHNLGVGGDGRWLVFTSAAALTADDTDGSKVDIFRYDAETELLNRVSKAAPDGSDSGAFDVTVGPRLGFPGQSATNVAASPEYLTRGRWVSENAEVIAFKSAEALVPQDANTVRDSYLWRDGELVLLPGTSDPANVLVDQPLVSMDGQTVAFQSAQRLLPRDGDTAIDVYALRPGGGFPEPPAPQPCQPDGDEGCQGPAAPAPAESNAASSAIQGRGNLSAGRSCAALSRRATRLSRRAKARPRSSRLAKRAERAGDAAKRCRRANRRGAR
ncbi:MAG TPA: hypothetical protein VFY04_08695 [Solirubrobacterales bacterium]|nr:hypothetical protein [Solirubrobacterales bacterium]